MNILFIIFNRPTETRTVFESIREAKPSRLCIAADGPRKDNKEDYMLCEQVRLSVSNIDWPCEVVTRFQEKNLGCKKHVSSAITWFLEHVEEGIILEDDCLPDQSFFTFVQAMLERYRSNNEVMHISGANFNVASSPLQPSYYFSQCPHIWGWATWKRAWETYDIDMNDLSPYIESRSIYTLFKSKDAADFWISLFKHIKGKNIDTWDAQWAYSIIKNKGKAITPKVNLVKNIGFGDTSTHTTNKNGHLSHATHHMEHIIHPQNTEVDRKIDDILVHTLYIESFWNKLFRRLKIR
jgi:hypothetical protein